MHHPLSNINASKAIEFVAIVRIKPFLFSSKADAESLYQKKVCLLLKENPLCLLNDFKIKQNEYFL